MSKCFLLIINQISFIMKKLALLTIFGFFVFTLHAQHVFNKGDMMLNAGIGSFSGYGLLPSVNASLEVGSIPTGDVGIVSFGGIAAFQIGNYSNSSTAFSVLTLGPRAAWHLQTFSSDKWDVYAGFGFGVFMRSGYTDIWGFHNNGIVTGYGEGFIGGRMMLKDNFGLFAESGYGTLSSFKFGITLGL